MIPRLATRAIPDPGAASGVCFPEPPVLLFNLTGRTLFGPPAIPRNSLDVRSRTQ